MAGTSLLTLPEVKSQPTDIFPPLPSPLTLKLIKTKEMVDGDRSGHVKEKKKKRVIVIYNKHFVTPH